MNTADDGPTLLLVEGFSCPPPYSRRRARATRGYVSATRAYASRIRMPKWPTGPHKWPTGAHEWPIGAHQWPMRTPTWLTRSPAFHRRVRASPSPPTRRAGDPVQCGWGVCVVSATMGHAPHLRVRARVVGVRCSPHAASPSVHTGGSVLHDLRQGPSVRELVHQPREDVPQGTRVLVQCGGGLSGAVKGASSPPRSRLRGRCTSAARQARITVKA